MKIFKQKDFTLAEGHYTGPKDQDKVPGAVEVVSKSALGGALAGGVVGAIDKEKTILEGAWSGTKWGFLGGMLMKFFLNYLHNPMTQIKYQEVDKMIRREFGIYRAAGVTVGDTIDKRASVDERFGFNDRFVTNYKLTFTVQDNRVTMYTFCLTDDELRIVDSTLDYYCKKYTGMDYASTVLNRKTNSYSAMITFTNYQVVSNFIMELSNKLGVRINLMDNKALVHHRLLDATRDVEEEKSFSEVKDINKYEFAKILSKAVCMVPIALMNGSIGQTAGYLALKALAQAGNKIAEDELAKMGVSMPRESYSNKFLVETLKKLHYVEGVHYSIGRKDVSANISLISGRLVVTVGKDDAVELDREFWGPYRRIINRADTGKGKVAIYTYMINSRKEFENIINKLFSTGIMFNVFEG